MKKKILVIEKNQSIIEIIAIVLTSEGYDVRLSQTETGILDQILEYQPDAILLDIVFPSEEGTELCRTIKATESIKNIPVIVLSTYNKIEKVKEICADEVIEKPFDISFLLETVKSQLPKRVN
jgi:DNA-binding response OmpR family regulator